jgi:accessory gene regulator B
MSYFNFLYHLNTKITRNLCYYIPEIKQEVGMSAFSPKLIATKFSERAILFGNIDPREKDRIRYGLEWGISGFYQIALTLLIGYSVGLFIETLLVLTTISSLRLFAGGAHFSNFNYCLIASVSLIIGIAFSGPFLLHIFSNVNTLLLITYPILLAFLWNYAPVLFKKRNKKTNREIQQAKHISITISVAFMLLSFCLPDIYALAIYTALFFQVFTITPFGIKIIHFIDSKLTKRR